MPLDLTADTPGDYTLTPAGGPVQTNVATPRKINVAQIDQKHPEYKVLRDTWYKLGLLYASGWAIKSESELFLLRRPKENSDVYQARQGMFTHVNHLGTALDWYCSTLFEEDPHIQAVSKDRKAGEVDTSKDIGADTKTFYDSFLKDCDNAGTSFVDLFRATFQYALLYKKAYIVMDLPPAATYSSLEEQKKAGALNPYLCVYSPLDVINWQLDQYGNLDWIIIKVSVRNAQPKKAATMIDRWYFYDRTSFEVWERERPEDEKTPPDGAFAELTTSGNHILAKDNKVPVQVLNLPDGLWLANRAMLAAIAHLNTDNVLNFALFMAALAMPVIFADGNLQVNLSEAGYLQLPEKAKYEWTEPEGTSFQHLANRLSELTENIFRSFYLIHQGRSGRATPSAQSGVSKQMDMMPSKDILKMFGDMLRAFMQRVLDMVAFGHNDDKAIEWDVRGFEFKDDLSLEEVQAIGEMLSLDVPSDMFQKELSKRLAKAGLPDANPSVVRQIFKQIDDAKSRVDRQMDQMQQKAQILSAASGKPPQISQAQKTSKTAGQDSGPPDNNSDAS